MLETKILGEDCDELSYVLLLPRGPEISPPFSYLYQVEQHAE